ncbi:unnamed protein product [Fusarium graminearum]|nr:unnamed protein product [Fusarium graminearum]CAG2012366.1 unnamed protein product [Fusarium graminearum]
MPQAEENICVEVELTINSAKGHARASADESGKGLAVGSDKLAALSRVFLLLVEVKDEVLVVGKKGKEISGAGQVEAGQSDWGPRRKIEGCEEQPL